MFDGRQGDLPPEIHLLFAILIQAIEDLESSDDKVRFEAHEFFLQPKGGWRDARDNLLTACGLDEEAVLLAIKDRIEDPPPERPQAIEMPSDVLFDRLPMEAFSAGFISRKLGVRLSIVSARLTHLEKHGRVRRVDRGLFMRTDSEQTYVPKEPKPPKKPMRDRILASLMDGPKTIRQIGFSIEGDADTMTIRYHLNMLIAQGKVERDPPEYRFVPKPPEHEELLETLKVGPMTPRDVASKLSITYYTAYGRLMRALARGLVARDGTLFFLPAPYRVVAANRG